ncbi:NAD(P)H-binding protein [Sphingobium baderi]|uniref:NAD(P)H-binding protein n=1 Tax=Sphingobium baderi TaxID=1332080 RepID=UPI0004CE65A8|nr:NAD(P)H-binding protein [Sphingobium baderi]KMS61380.1 nucleoside-diphosphate sugar epimerase [Sphingobium baderi LL03]
MTKPAIAVTGASGQLGQKVLEHLLSAGASHVIAVTRNPDALAAWQARGIHVRHGDFNDPASLDVAFSGVERMVMIATDEMATPGLRIAQHGNAVAAAQRVGVGFVAYTSMINPGPDSPVSFLPDHYATETLIGDSGIAHGILRHGWYLDNLLATLPAVLASGTWLTSAGDGRASYIARDDAARAAAALLLADRPAEGMLEIVGSPMAVTEMVEIVSRVFDQSIQLLPLSDKAFVEALSAAGVPAPFAALAASVDSNTRLGRADVQSDAFEHLTGQLPQTLEQFLTAHRDVIKDRVNALAQ